jgi:RimK family alpha-L-glutamate ligase
MRILIVGLIKGSQIQRLREEAKKLGHEVVGCHSSDLLIKTDGKSFNASILGNPLEDFDLIYLCAGIESKFRFEWYIACDYLKKYFKTKIVNNAVVDPNLNYYPVQTWFYLKQFENSVVSPQTFVIYTEKNLVIAEKELGYPMIIKISETHQGKGIFLAKNRSQAEKIISKNKNKTILLRKFIANKGDIRIFTVGFKAIGGMKRIASKNDFRSNISQGGTGKPFDLIKYPKIRALAEKSAKISGIEIAGVDIMIGTKDKKPYVLEVNSGPQFKGLEKYTKTNAALEIIKYFELVNK